MACEDGGRIPEDIGFAAPHPVADHRMTGHADCGQNNVGEFSARQVSLMIARNETGISDLFQCCSLHDRTTHHTSMMHGSFSEPGVS
jgi:hypothetical protein